MSTLTGEQIHRAAGVLLAMACGDALGAGYEFGPPLSADTEVAMVGGGSFGWEPGEWTDDTDMAIVIARAVADGGDLRATAVADAVAAGWWDWARKATDVGMQTSSVLHAAVRAGGPGAEPTAEALQVAAAEHHRVHGQSGGNGSLMRTAPVALAYLHDEDGLVEAASAVSALTHFDHEAGEACVLWCLAIRHAVLTGDLDMRVGLSRLPADRAAVWAQRLHVAETSEPRDFDRNGWVVQALQAAWCAITTTRGRGDREADHLRLALEAAVRGGRDTDTVAAIAGGLLGGVYGASAVPGTWRRRVHGWPGLRGRDLVRLGVLIARGGRPDRQGWPSAPTVDYSSWDGTDVVARHPHDEGVWLSGVDVITDPPAEVDAVVSLCRLGAGEVPSMGIEVGNHVEVWLVDSASEASNPHLDFVLDDTADLIGELRAEGLTVLVHCVAARSRTPSVAALHSMRVAGVSAREAIEAVRTALPEARPNRAFRAALSRAEGGGL
jgi:ADP-ribosylglycohydrolase/predicted protein tyrosine phosphatase